MAASKRLHNGYEQDGDQPDDKRMRRLPSFSTVIREAMMQKQMQNLFRCLEPLLRRVVQEELQAGLMQSPRYIERLPETTSPAKAEPERAAWKLAFRNPPHLPIFTGSKIEDEAGNPLEIILVDADTGSPALLPLSLPQPLRVEVVPVFGDFPPDAREDWSADEFQRNVVKEREGKRPLLTGEVSLTMRDGRATVSELQFTDNSSWVRCRRFRIAVRVVPGTAASGVDGVRIQEAMTDAFVVRDHRGELYRKHYPPAPADYVWRLEKIGKEGAFHRKLKDKNIGNVQEFVRMLMVKPDELRGILGDGMTDRMWEVTTNHAKTCAGDGKVYAHDTPNGTIYVDSLFNLVRVDIGGVQCWPPLQQLNRGQMIMVQQMLLDAYENRHRLQETEAFMLHGHAAANNVPLLQNAAAQVALPAAADTPLWFTSAGEMDFPVDDVVVPIPQANNSFSYQWTGQQAFHMAG